MISFQTKQNKKHLKRERINKIAQQKKRKTERERDGKSERLIRYMEPCLKKNNVVFVFLVLYIF